jgi:hypothetical protein
MFRGQKFFMVQYRPISMLGQFPCGKWHEIPMEFKTQEDAQRWIRDNAELFQEYTVCHCYRS